MRIENYSCAEAYRVAKQAQNHMQEKIQREECTRKAWLFVFIALFVANVVATVWYYSR